MNQNYNFITPIQDHICDIDAPGVVMYKFIMFPNGYTHSEHADVRRSRDLIDQSIGLDNVVWPKGVKAAADILEKAGALSPDILAGLIATPLMGTTRFARVDLSAQNAAGAFNRAGLPDGETVEQRMDRMLTSSDEVAARVDMARFLTHMQDLPRPETRGGDLAWYQLCHAMVYCAGRVAENGQAAADLFSPGLLSVFSDTIRDLSGPLANVDSDEVEDLPGLQKGMSEACQRLDVITGRYAIEVAARAADQAAAQQRQDDMMRRLHERGRRAPRL